MVYALIFILLFLFCFVFLLALIYGSWMFLAVSCDFCYCCSLFLLPWPQAANYQCLHFFQCSWSSVSGPILKTGKYSSTANEILCLKKVTWGHWAVLIPVNLKSSLSISDQVKAALESFGTTLQLVPYSIKVSPSYSIWDNSLLCLVFIK